MEEKYYLGDATVDREHTELFDIIEDFKQNQINDDEVEEKFIDTMNDLYRHTVIHFNDEEGLMLAAKVPSELYEEHRVEHIRIRNLLGTIKKTPLHHHSSIEMLDIIAEVLVVVEDHIIDFDMLLKEYL